jgi:hypothetical protein
MPRIARPAPPEVGVAIATIKTFCSETGTNVNALANEVGIKQSALCRFVNGERKTITQAAEQTLRYIDSRHNRHNRGSGAKISLRQADGDADNALAVVEEAVHSHWDGSRRGAELLAALIRAVAPLIRLASGHTKNSETSPR